DEALDPCLDTWLAQIEPPSKLLEADRLPVVTTIRPSAALSAPKVSERRFVRLAQFTGSNRAVGAPRWHGDRRARPSCLSSGLHGYRPVSPLVRAPPFAKAFAVEDSDRLNASLVSRSVVSSREEDQPLTVCTQRQRAFEIKPEQAESPTSFIKGTVKLGPPS